MRVLLFALTSTAASAQAPVYDAARFAPPLQVGNQWQYVEANHQPTTPVAFQLHAYSITEEVVIGGEMYSVLTRQDLSPDGAPTSPVRHCATSRTVGDAPAAATGLPDYDCSYFDVLSVPAPHTSGPTTVTANVTLDISGQPVVVDSTLWFGTSSQGSGGAFGYTSAVRATGIGYVSWRIWGSRHWVDRCVTNPSECQYDTRWSLAYTRLGGVVYGAPIVADETTPEPSRSFAVSAFPNPSASDVTVTTAGASGSVAFDVFDALGRRVAQGAGPGFTFQAAAVGVYTIRATDTEGQTATTRVVRR